MAIAAVTVVAIAAILFLERTGSSTALERSASSMAPKTHIASSSVLSLSRVPWYGGPTYYSKFSKAAAVGWTSASHFPIGVWFGKPGDAGQLAKLGINTYVAAEHDGSPITDITNHGIDVVAQGEWTPAQIGHNPHVVGWHVSDECDQGAGGCGGDEYTGLATQQRWSKTFRSRNDGRFLHSNWSKGVLNSYWATHTMTRLIDTVDVSSDDQYAYTSPSANYALLNQNCCWPAGKEPDSAGAYGYVMDRLQSYSDSKQPGWTVVETARPLLGEYGARTIQPSQIEGAVWNAIIHGASGILYFQHNNDPSCGMYSLVQCSQSLKNKVTTIDADVQTMAPVLNTQSYRWNFSPSVDTMLKLSGGYAYVFAMTSRGTGSRTLTLPSGMGSSVTVVGENRTLPIESGSFTDTFPDEVTHHIYKIKVKP